MEGIIAIFYVLILWATPTIVTVFAAQMLFHDYKVDRGQLALEQGTGNGIKTEKGAILT